MTHNRDSPEWLFSRHFRLLPVLLRLLEFILKELAAFGKKFGEIISLSRKGVREGQQQIKIEIGAATEQDIAIFGSPQFLTTFSSYRIDFSIRVTVSRSGN